MSSSIRLFSAAAALAATCLLLPAQGEPVAPSVTIESLVCEVLVPERPGEDPAGV